MRNPVAGVLALAEAVQTAPNAQMAKKRSAELLDAAREASELTNKLLSFERASGTDIAQSGAKVDLRQLLKNAVLAFQSQHSECPLAFDLNVPPDIVLIKADATMLQEAILNLFSNSLVHGGPKVSNVSVRMYIAGQMATVIISDNGVGIPPDRHLEALSRFSQAGGGPGSGLGLAIAARVLKNHQGELDIQDTADGASIRLSLPITQP